MIAEARDVAMENVHLRLAFEQLGLDADVVLPCEVGGLAAENERLGTLLVWARAWRACPDRQVLERRGYLVPPVQDGCSPDAAWFRFERWMRGMPLSWSFAGEAGRLREPQGMSASEVSEELDRIRAILADNGVLVDLCDGLPDRVAYAYLRESLQDADFEIMPPGMFTHIDGCTGYCPACLQRPWCDIEDAAVWEDDGESEEHAGGEPARRLLICEPEPAV